MCIIIRLGPSSVYKTNLIIIPLTLVSIVALFVFNLENFVPQRMFPILGNGFFSTFVLGLTNLSAFGGIAYIYFLPPLLKDPKKLKQISIISVCVIGIYLILCVSIILFIFTSLVSANEIMPLYFAARHIDFGTFFQRLESLSLLIWILAFASYLGTCTTISIGIFKKLTNIKDIKPIANIFVLLILGVSLLPNNMAICELIASNFYCSFVIGIVFILGLSILIIANLKERKKLKVGNSK